MFKIYKSMDRALPMVFVDGDKGMLFCKQKDAKRFGWTEVDFDSEISAIKAFQEYWNKDNPGALPMLFGPKNKIYAVGTFHIFSTPYYLEEL